MDRVISATMSCPKLCLCSTTDDDLIAMYLTDKKNGIERELDDHEELEVLLESFSKQVEEIVNEAENIEVKWGMYNYQTPRP